MTKLRRKHDDDLGANLGTAPPDPVAGQAVAPSGEAASPPAASPWLSPGVVTELRPDGALGMRLPSGVVVVARLALALPYRAELGDELLLLGDGERAFVTGVIAGRGLTELRIGGAVRIAAEGKLELASATSIAIDAPQIEVRAGRLSRVVDTVSDVVGTVHQTITRLWSTRAKEQHTLVEGTSQLVAKNARTLSEGKVTINGKEIFLG